MEHNKLRRPSAVRIVLGVGLIIIGIVSLGIIFDPQGIPAQFEDRLAFITVAVAISLTIGFGGWLLSQYPLRLFLKVTLGFVMWFSFVFLPIFLLPLPGDVMVLALSGSLLLLALLASYFTKKDKTKEDITY